MPTRSSTKKPIKVLPKNPAADHKQQKAPLLRPADCNAITAERPNQVPETLAEIEMVRAVYEESKMTELKLALDTNDERQALKIARELVYDGPGTLHI